MNDAASFDAIMQCNLLEVFCEALGAAIFVTDKLDQVTFASIRLLHFYPIRQTAIEPGSRARDLYGSLFDAGCRFGQSGKQGGRTRDEWIAERTAIAWKERVDTIEQAGPDRWVRIVSRRFSSGLGFVVMQDVSEQKKKENLLRAEQERVKLTEEILDTLPVPVAVKDRNLHFVAVNQKFAELAQLPADSILGRNSWDIVDAELAGRMEQADWQLLSSGHAQTDQVTVKRSDGSAVTIERHARRVGRPGNHFISMSLAQSVGHSAAEKAPEGRPVPRAVPAASAATPAAPPILEETRHPAGSRKVLYLIGTHYTGHGLTLGLAAHDVELCLIRDEQEFASFVPAANAAGLAIDFVLIDGDFSPSAFNIVANAGFDFRMIAPGSEDSTALAEILRSLEAREQKNPRRAPTGAASTATHPPVVSAPRGKVEPDDRLDVLAVEDNPVNRMALEQILESLEFRFTTVASGREAIAAAAIARPRLVLADLTLPDMDIDELAGALRRSNAGLPVIGLMPADNEGNREKCAAAGLVDCIAKPLSPDALDIIIREHRIPDPAIAAARSRPAA
ncbi:response regulator [Rhizobium sp. TH2]|uniref:response regulator n=1 Tax=Rhizobium sp. TH2 TaxID=2775403 RepID=UPI00215873A0|nr:response regulator [Rhizobium sp. TH2]UVC09687.1 response regulator [Rhizobium sp. TH2]